MHIIQKKLFHLATATFFRVFLSLSSILITILSVKVLNIADLDNFYFYLSIASILIVLITFGTNISFVKNAALKYDHEQLYKKYKEILVFISINILIAAPIVTVLVFTEIVEQIFLVVFIIIILISLQLIISEYHRATNNFLISQIYSNATTVISVYSTGMLSASLNIVILLVIMLTVKHITLNVYILLMLMTGMITVIIEIVTNRKIYHFNKEELVQFVKSYPDVIRKHRHFFFFTVSINLYSILDVFIVKYFAASEGEVSIYSIAQKFVIFFQLPQTFLISYYQPQLAQLISEHKYKEIESVARKVTKSIFALSLVATACYLLLGKYVIVTLFGEFFVESYYLMLIKAVGYLFQTGLGIAGGILIIAGYEKVFTYMSVVLVGVSVAASLAFNMLFQMPIKYTTTYGFMISYVVYCFAMYFLCVTKMGIRISIFDALRGK